MWKLGVPKELGVDHDYLRFVTVSKKTYKNAKRGL
jgi:hypothetical protein